MPPEITMQEQGDKSDGKVLIESIQESRRNDPNREATGQVWMFISAALFGYFGFGVGWDHTGMDGQFLPFVAIIEWSLKGGAIGFGLAGLLCFVAGRPAEFVYAVVGLLTAFGFVLGATLDILDTQHTAMSPLLLFIFAGFNGWSSFVALRHLLATR